MHCFGGGWEQARRSLDLGFLVSFAGNLTYPKAQPLRDVAARVPLDRILVETDTPVRGWTPKDVWQTLTLLSEIKKRPEDEVLPVVNTNAERFFNLHTLR